MRKKLILIFMVLSLTGCSRLVEPVDGDLETVSLIESTQEETNRKESLAEGNGQEKTESISQQEQPVGEEKPPQELTSYADKTFSVNGEERELTDAEWDRVLTAWTDLQKEKPALPKENGTEEDYFIISTEEEEHIICLVRGKSDTYVSVDSRVEYPCTDEISSLFEKYCPEEQITDGYVVSYDDPEEQLIGLSVECEEPKNQEEYLQAARAVVKPWLDGLQSRTDEYRLPSYTFTDRLAENREFHGDGDINGGREFVCYVAFETLTEEEDTVFFAEGTYDTFYHYYFGPGILARFRWENGVCTLIDYDEAFAMLTADRLTDGLYGISEEEPEYKTFYDFLNDRENVRTWLEKGYRSRLCSYRVSHNVMMLANGKIIFMDIGDSGRPDYNGDMVTSEMNQYYYDAEGDEKYSSPVDYIDGQGAVVMTYREGFPVVYDDYNHDGNPDFCLRISSDEYGSTYDVRCMDTNGTPWEDDTEVYIYGAFEESIRLQVYNGNSILKPVDNGDGSIIFQEQRLFGDKSNAIHAEVTDEPLTEYRMYSQKFYLPEHLRYYTKQDGEVICYFWNNTEEAATLKKEYEIQRKNGDAWETVGTGTMDAVTVSGCGYEKLSFDISDIDSEEMALYRIKTYVGDVPVYGGFYYGTEGKTSLDITAEEYPDYTNLLSFTISNTGMSATYPSSAVLYFDGKKLCDVNLNNLTRINGGENGEVVVTNHDIAGEFEVGEYTLELVADGATFRGTANVISVPAERRYYFPQKVNASKKVDVISLPLTNNIWNRENAVIVRMGDIEVFKEGKWYSTLFFNEMFEGYSEDLVIPFGETVEADWKDNSDRLGEVQEYFEQLKSFADSEYAGAEEYAEIKDMTFEEFVKDALDIMQAESGDLCRVRIYFTNSGSESEYVYFEMP